MSKNHENQQRYLYIDGQAVPVTEEVYRAYWHYTDKEDYFTRLLKTERLSVDQEHKTVTFTPSREDSFDRLLAADKQFSAQAVSVEDEVISALWLEELLSLLTEDERSIIGGIFFEQRTERELSVTLHISQNTVHYWKEKALKKLRGILEKNF